MGRYVFLEAVSRHVIRTDQEAVYSECLISPLSGLYAVYNARRTQAVWFPKFVAPIVARDVLDRDDLTREVVLVFDGVRPKDVSIAPGSTLLDYTIGGKTRDRLIEKLLWRGELLFHEVRRKVTTHSRFTPR